MLYAHIIFKYCCFWMRLRVLPQADKEYWFSPRWVTTLRLGREYCYSCPAPEPIWHLLRFGLERQDLHLSCLCNCIDKFHHQRPLSSAADLADLHNAGVCADSHPRVTAIARMPYSLPILLLRNNSYSHIWQDAERKYYENLPSLNSVTSKMCSCHPQLA